MRTKEKQRIFDLHSGYTLLVKNTTQAARWFPFYSDALKELKEKEKDLYNLFIKEDSGTSRETTLNRYYKARIIRSALKLVRAVTLEAGTRKRDRRFVMKPYSYSDLSRPEEHVRTARLTEVLAAAKRLKNAERYGISKKEFSETEKNIRDYIAKSKRAMSRKKERAMQAKQCRKLLHEINFILHKKMLPFFENIKEQYEVENRAFHSYLKPVKTGRPPLKKTRKRKAAVPVPFAKGKNASARAAGTDL